ncbi:MAG: Rne/Rng family ribonuclease, partial [Qingshengfaniella sp.]
MPKKMLIDATHAEETRVVVVDGSKVEEFDFESENKRQLAGNIYLAKVTRVEPSLQAAFVDYGGNRHGFLAFTEIHPDYYQIPVADREALMAEELAYSESLKRDEGEETAEEDALAAKPKPRRRSRSRAARNTSADPLQTADLPEAETGNDGEAAPAIAGMEVVSSEGDNETADELAPVLGDPAPEMIAPAETDHMLLPDARDAGPAPADAEPTTEEAGTDDIVDADSGIESVADDDTPEEIRREPRPRPRRYKIQEVIKVRQILLVQVVKEERGNKGAALTTYLSLAGRYCVLMPNTARGGGISRKITNATDRKKLKQIAGEIEVPKGAGLIIRTAGAKRTKAEIKRDYEYLQRLWEQIRELTLKSVAPAKIYEEGDLIKRSIRDLYNREIDEVLVEGEGGYRTAKDFMKMIMPSHAKNVKQYTDPMPLFSRHQVESYLNGMFNPVVKLKSGGYIVIGVTEALVAIDVNSGKSTKEGSIEDTALKTNLEAAEEIARQLRLRDLAGLIVVDFIDMEERKNNAAVEKKFKDKLKTDRARIQVGRISGFGLLEMSRQRLRPGMIEATTQPCPHCHGTGLIRSDDNLALMILRELEEEGVRNKHREVLVKAPIGIANYLMNAKREHIAQIEARYGLSVRIESDPSLVSPDYTVEKFKTALRNVAPAAPLTPVVQADASLMEPVVVEEPEVEEDEAPQETSGGDQPAESEDDQKPRKRRRRRRRKRGGGDENGAMDENGTVEENAASDETGTAADNVPTEVGDTAPTPEGLTPPAETALASVAEAVVEETVVSAEVIDLPEAASQPQVEDAAPMTAPDPEVAPEADIVPVAEDPTPVEAVPEPSAAPVAVVAEE